MSGTNSNRTHCDECGNKVQRAWVTLNGAWTAMDTHVFCETCNTFMLIDVNKFWKPWHSEEKEVW